jgi:hypothetical protein
VKVLVTGCLSWIEDKIDHRQFPEYTGLSLMTCECGSSNIVYMVFMYASV